MERFSVETSATDGRVTVAGELDLAAAGGLRQALDRRLAEAETETGSGTVVVDCAGITFIDSIGLRTLIEASGKAEQAGVGFILEAVPAPVARVFELAGVTELFAIRTNDEEALTD